MNAKDIVIFAGVAMVAFMLLKRSGGGKSAWTTEIRNPALPGQTGYGWRYFSDGTSIGPDGTYYRKGEAVYSPTYDGVSVGGNYPNLTT